MLLKGGLLGAAVLLGLAASQAGAATYTLIELVPVANTTESIANAVNDNGDVVGGSRDNGAVETWAATKWDGATNAPVALNPVTGKTSSLARGINNSGDTVGESFDGGCCNNPAATKWDGTTNAPIALVPLTGTQAIANGINDSGDVVGESSGVATKWDGTTNAPTALNPITDGPAPYRGWNINNSGDIAGASGNGIYTGTRWDGTTNAATALDPLSGGIESIAFGINDNGDVVGHTYAWLNNNNFYTATLWDGKTNAPTALNPVAGGEISQAFGINNSGDVVGFSERGSLSSQIATLWVNGVAIDLNSMLDLTGAGWTLLIAWDINNLGQIAGNGINAVGQRRGFLLTPNSIPPVPLPAALPLLASALGALGFIGWRRKRMAAA